MTSPSSGRRAVRTALAPAPRGHYSQAVVAGDVIYTAGLGPLDPVTRSIVGGDNVAEQTRQVFRNLSAILAAAGSSLDEVVKVTAFLTDAERDWDAYDAVFAEFFTAPYPARLTAGAVLGDILVEIEVVAHCRGQ